MEKLHVQELEVVPVSQECFDFIEKQLEKYFNLLEQDLTHQTEIWIHTRIEKIESLLIGGTVVIKEQVK